ncbi:MAG TPA: S1 RNA-binding domain-containing protein [Candidatus Aenigmarchaeota archaeon]|nr:MAG: hypothetical protein DRP03_01690 [Candidatus Aenigmarchaeota archaeon]HDD46232.1 S1 RNA-binding domain-containing protein [Candidatus Aenigmarchaeota archaeon]
MKKSGNPEVGELVVCKITKLNPNSAYAELLEYPEKNGIIHISEVASRWVKNIKEFLKLNQYVVCKVIYFDGKMVSLSIKRVRKEDASRKLDEFKKERRAEKMLEMAAKLINKTIDDVYREIGDVVENEFGSFEKLIDIAMKNEDMLASKGISKEWIDAIKNIVEKSRTKKVYEVKCMLELFSYKPDGIELIKNVLKQAEIRGVEIKYISAPKYMLIGRGENYKELKVSVTEICNRIVKEIERLGGKGKFKILK